MAWQDSALFETADSGTISSILRLRGSTDDVTASAFTTTLVGSDARVAVMVAANLQGRSSRLV